MTSATYSMQPNSGLSDESNLDALITMLATVTSDRRSMPESEIRNWIRLYRGFLMVEYEGTIQDVFDAAQEWLTESRFFPTVKDLVPGIEARVVARREREMKAAAQDAAVALPELESGNTDYQDIRTADLPPGYDYADDPHWQAGIDLMARAVEAKGDLGAVGNLARDLARKREQNQSVGFQGASKPRELTCPTCNGARYLRLGGWDSHPDDIGNPSSKYVMCRTCCPHGEYSERAERDAARRATTHGMAAD